MDGTAERKKRGRPRQNPEAVRSRKLYVPCTATYMEWVNGLARADGRPLTLVVERAMRAYAAVAGFPEPPPGR